MKSHVTQCGHCYIPKIIYKQVFEHIPLKYYKPLLNIINKFLETMTLSKTMYKETNFTIG